MNASTGSWDEDHALLLHEVAALLSPPSASYSALDADQDLALLNALLDAPPSEDTPALLHMPVVPSAPAPPALPPPPVAVATATGAVAKEQSAPDWQTLKTTRERQRAELEYLRGKVAELEKELLEAAPSSTSRHQSADSSNSDAKDASWWAAAAQRQHQERNRSEEQNAKLRELALGQIRLAKSLEKVLEKRRMWEGMARKSTKRPRLQAGEADEDAFAHLKHAIDSRTLSVDAIFKEQGLDTMVDETSDAVITDNDASAGIRLDFKVVQLHPFEFRAFDQAAWRFIHSALLESVGGAIVEQSEHSIALRLSYAPRPNLPLRVRSVFKRVVEPERVVVTWESETESDATGSQPPIRLRESGWGTIEPIRLPNTSVACITRHFTRATPTMEALEEDVGEQQEQRRLGPGALTDLIIASYLQSTQLTHQAIDDMLLDEQLAQSGRLGERVL